MYVPLTGMNSYDHISKYPVTIRTLRGFGSLGLADRPSNWIIDGIACPSRPQTPGTVTKYE